MKIRGKANEKSFALWAQLNRGSMISTKRRELGARERSRTSMGLPPLAPEASVSAIPPPEQGGHETDQSGQQKASILQLPIFVNASLISRLTLCGDMPLGDGQKHQLIRPHGGPESRGHFSHERECVVTVTG